MPAPWYREWATSFASATTPDLSPTGGTTAGSARQCGAPSETSSSFLPCQSCPYSLRVLPRCISHHPCWRSRIGRNSGHGRIPRDSFRGWRAPTQGHACFGSAISSNLTLVSTVTDERCPPAAIYLLLGYLHSSVLFERYWQISKVP